MSETVSLTIDGKQITVPKGTSVIEATKKMGVEIPHFCWHPGLSVAGVCRFCMVKIEGMPKLQIACNTQCTEGMKVITQAADVKDAHKWALEFHLINHPLDCPICDQAGECELQNYYMKVGKYTSEMKEQKVLKPKALDVGKTLVLDTERCILCSRCVRFEDEVTKTSSLGIFNRGDKSVIGTFPNKKIDHNYSYNLADVCPVGAFTAKDFRFKCRVWFLKETPSICPGCSTGCNVNLFQNKNQRQYYRLKPVHNDNVNGHWMCDYGREMFEHLNAKNRFALPLLEGNPISWQQVKHEIKHRLHLNQNKKVTVIFTPQYTVEEYDHVLKKITEETNVVPDVYVWRDSHENVSEFDGILMRGDKNPNTQGLKQVLSKYDLTQNHTWSPEKINELPRNDLTFIFAPEIQKSFKSFGQDMQRLVELSNVICFSACRFPGYEKFMITVPTHAFAEKDGTFVNYNGIAQKLTANPPVFPGLLSISDLFGPGPEKM